jgi:hypothetical protein
MQKLFEIYNKDWKSSYSKDVQSQAIAAFETGKIIVLPHLTFELNSQEKVFFSTEFSHPKFKNISYNPKNDCIRGAKCKGEHYIHLKDMMSRYAQYVQGLISLLFPLYNQTIQMGRTSFRPIEIEGRIPKSYRKDDTRLHVDAFPMSPTQGKRICRMFTNINPYGKERVWHIGEPFCDVAKQFLPRVGKPWPGRSRILKTIGLTKSDESRSALSKNSFTK